MRQIASKTFSHARDLYEARLLAVIAALVLVTCSAIILSPDTEESEGVTTYEVVFDAPGGDSGKSHGEYKINSGTTIQLPVTTFQCSGQLIQYWQTNTGAQYAPGDSYTVRSNVTFTAIYETPNGNHVSDHDTVVSIGEQVELNPYDFTSGSGQLDVNHYPDWMTLQADQHVSGSPSEPGVYYFQASKAWLGINPTYYWIQVLVPSSFDDMTQISGINITGETQTYVGQTKTYEADISPSNATYERVEWSVSGSGIQITSTTDSTCTVRFTDSGNASLVARALDGSEVQDSISINIGEQQTALTSVRITASGSGDYTTVNATFTPSNAGIDSVSWSVSSGSAILSNESNSSVRVSPDGNGRSQIRISVEDTSGNTRTATCYVYGYQFVFNTNGGSGGPGTVEAISSSSSYRLDIPSSEPYRSGYEFMGWSTNSSGSGTLYNYGDSYSGSYSSVRNLYAVWGTEITIYFDNDGGSGGPTSQNYLVREDGYSECSIPSSQPYRSGYVFMGWSWTINDDGIDCEAGGVYDFYDSDDGETMYAIWGINTNITYNLNGESGSVASQQFTVYDGNTQSVTLRTTVPSNSYREFLGWSTNSGATTASYQPGGSFPLTAGNDVTLYAVWDDLSYTLTFNAGSGVTDAQGMPGPLSGESGTGSCTFTLPTPPTRDQYDFAGWSTSDGGSVTYPVGTSSVTLQYTDPDVVLYAVWTPWVYYTLTFDANGGQDAPGAIQSRVVDGWAHFIIPDTEPTRSEWDFVGWSLDSNPVSATYFPSGEIDLNASDTLYAVWTPALIAVMDIELSYEPSVLIGNQVIVTATAVPDNATTPGITFVITSGNGTLASISQSITSTGGTATISGLSNGVITVVAYATDDSGITKQFTIEVQKTITVTYDANGGEGAPAVQTVNTAQDSALFTISDTIPTFVNHTFLGWAVNDPSAQSPNLSPGQTEVNFSSSMVLYAVWQHNVLDISGTPNPTGLKVGTSWTFNPILSDPDCEVVIEGADWLYYNEGAIVGTPFESGSYDVTITVTKDNFESDSMSFTLTVVPVLEWLKAPSGGAIAYAV